MMDQLVAAALAASLIGGAISTLRGYQQRVDDPIATSLNHYTENTFATDGDSAAAPEDRVRWQH